VALVLGVLSSTIVLYGYLSVFDWHLIWIIDYPDILKFGLVVLVMITSFLFTLQGFIENVLLVRSQTGISKKITIAILILLPVIWLLSAIYQQWGSPEPGWYKIFIYSTAFVFFAIWMVDISSWIHENRLPTFRELGSRLRAPRTMTRSARA